MSGLSSADGWTTVTQAARPRRKSRSGPLVMPYNTTAASKSRLTKNPRNLETVTHVVSHDAERLLRCPWWSAATSEIASRRFPGLICLGLGPFLSSVNARAQLAAAIRLRTDFVREGAPCFLADPAMTPEDDGVARSAGFTVVGGFDEALDALGEQGGSDELLVFMPHCERILYEEVLSRLWGVRLESVALFGNCFSSFYGAGEGVESNWHYMDAVIADGVAVEHPCGDSTASIWHNAFNDLALTFFDGSQSKRYGRNGFWSWRPQSLQF
jgi:SRR1